MTQKCAGEFSTCDRGAVATLFALSLFACIIAVGSALDLAHQAKSRSALQGAVDSAVLAVATASLDETERELQFVGEEFVRTHLVGKPELLRSVEVAIDVETTLSSRDVRVAASGEVTTVFLRLLGVSRLPIDVDARAARAARDIEIALVLDVSNSMKGQRLPALKEAARNFVDRSFEDAGGRTVHISLVPFAGSVVLPDPVFERYAVPLARAHLNPNQDAYAIGSAVSASNFRFSRGYNCLELTLQDFIDGEPPIQGRAQLPRTARFTCDRNDRRAIFHANDPELLRQEIDKFYRYGRTAMDEGAFWGLQALSPTSRGLGLATDDYPRPFDEDTLKFLIVMTDGGITDQLRPRNPRRAFNINRNSQFILRNGLPPYEHHSDTTQIRFETACEIAKNRGVIIFTIGFLLDEDDEYADKRLQKCASDISKYFYVDGFDLDSVFGLISDEVSRLRIIE